MASPAALGAAPPLLATKLHAPRRRRGTVPRPRLTGRAGVGDLPALTLVSAPAGFGKTTLVSEWFAAPADAPARTAWLSLDAADNDPATFWRYVVAALEAVAPGLGGPARALLGAAQPATAIAAALVNDLAALDHEVVLVLDDYHVIEVLELHEAVAFLVGHLPPNAHLVLATRADPPLPLARLRARGELLELRAADLRFTAEEAGRYLTEAMGLELSGEDVAVLEARTEGWAAALQLAALSMQGRDDASGFVASFAGDDRFVVDYLAEEVLERQPDEVRRFLLDTSVLDRLSGPLCDAVTGGHDGRAVLERLDRANLFVVPLDDRRSWYRYHHLFADVLRANLADEGDRSVELHRRAAAWFEAAGDPSAAIGHAVAGRDLETAARLVELAAPAMFQARREVTVRGWLGALPEALFADRPVLAVLAVGARMVSGQVEGVAPLLDGIERWLGPTVEASAAVVFDHDQFARLPAQVAVYRAALALIAGDLDATLAHAGRALDLAQPADHLPRGSAAALVGLASWARGELDTGVRRYAEAVERLTAAGHLSDVLGCSLALADLQVARGRLGDAAQTCEAGLRLARAHGVVRGTADLHVALGEVLFERGDRAGASAELAAARQLGEAAGLPQFPYRQRVLEARLRRAAGDLPGALELLAEAEAVHDTDLSPPVRPVPALAARAQLAAGDVAAARRWVVGRGLTVDDELGYLREFEHLTFARVLLAEHADPAATLRFVRRLLDAAEAGQRGSAVEALVLLALAQHAGGDRDDRATLAEALERAEPEGRVQVFLDELATLSPLLRDLAANPATPAGAAARRLLAEATAAPAAGPARPPQRLVDELSRRELDVLRLLRSDLTGPEIARELTVSLNTLRTHTKSIFVKLGASTRRQAVRRADELGL